MKFRYALAFVLIVVLVFIFIKVQQQPGYNMDMLNIISREEWNALPPNHDAPNENGMYNAVTNPEGWMVYEEPLDQVLKTVIVHHSALPLSDGPYEIQQLHFNQKGYADIAYHFIVDEDGNIYAGRDIHARGAHTGGSNTGSIGVVLLGNFEVINPTQSQLDALKLLLQVMKQEYHVTHLAGHKDFNPGVTLCPGENLYEKLPALAEELSYEYGTGGYEGP
jgi:hypothetical protein